MISLPCSQIFSQWVFFFFFFCSRDLFSVVRHRTQSELFMICQLFHSNGNISNCCDPTPKMSCIPEIVTGNNMLTNQLLCASSADTMRTWGRAFTSLRIFTHIEIKAIIYQRRSWQNDRYHHPKYLVAPFKLVVSISTLIVNRAETIDTRRSHFLLRFTYSNSSKGFCLNLCT